MELNMLNDMQKKAVLHTEGPLLILAGAGSGKTQTMTHRIAYLIEEGISPYNILAVTFTNKAAKEMRERVEKLSGELPGIWILTFHAMSLRILRKHCELIGYEKNFVVYDTVDQGTLIKNIIKDRNIDSKIYPKQYLLSIISKSKEQDISPEEFLKLSYENPKSKIIYEVYRDYQKQLKKNNAMDFDDLLRYCLHILRDNPDVLGEYQNKFKYIMVDEYQDTNKIQYEIIKLLAGESRNLCVVGDDDQCIYQWRGADIRNILDFEKDFKEAQVIKLEQNYRSHKNILEAAHSVIKNNRDRKSKKLWTDKEDGHKIVYKIADSDKEEAQYVANKICLMRSDRTYNDFAILYRTNAQSRLMEDALRMRQIPYRILSGLSFYERKETKDMISYMRMVVNPKDDISFHRIINEPKRGMGQTTLAKLNALAGVEGVSLYELLLDEYVIDSLSKKQREAVGELMELLKLLHNDMDKMKVSDIYDMLMVKSGYLKALEDEKTVEAESRIENLLDFKSYIMDFEKEKEEAQEEGTLSEFLETVSIQSDGDKYDENSGSVTLMTIHSAKGLEFPIVFLVGMEDGLFPGNRAMDEEKSMEEERRLCYVGITRAKERLILTSSKYRMLYGEGQYMRESKFLGEIDKRLFDEKGDAVYNKNSRTHNKLGIPTGSVDGYREAVYKPYDPLKYALNKAKSHVEEKDYTVGDKVTHPKFGFGIITDVSESVVTVNFETGGEKKLAKKVAPLKIV